jgi:hypothetical protein
MQLGPRKRIFLLIIIMIVIVMVAESISMGILYRTAINEERLRLVEIAKSQARLFEAIARFDKAYSNDYPFGSRAATLHQIKDAHSRYEGFGQTGEFTLSMKKRAGLFSY